MFLSIGYHIGQGRCKASTNDQNNANQDARVNNPLILLSANGWVDSLATFILKLFGGRIVLAVEAIVFGLWNRLLGPLMDCFAYLWMKKKYINYDVAKTSK